MVKPSTYAPGPVPSDPNALQRYLDQELSKIAAAFAAGQIPVSYAPPAKPRDGMLALADGTSWNPGGGAGYYGYRAGAWRKLEN